ncbi:hypothetical protein G7B40_041475 [Aetokthonos hydrillicola Thurmond2011]|jgi:hypothetical protein|uniref:Uncharacterized protein n=1 Tax=Aetokthonos hydrillicola Thurmond2011 TaxID=2712845 RepID=A0AAP5IGV3_9CYAN|nr:hypothetical protein [Aetokthonos hydrillicola]MBO3463072.1 hypothetical protein [Aetokthonos hydrillicola CCALA 1050]MDR9900937.1 hypothetical protein [Aetokthonos hydrillicola Thurmond2011]
MEHQCIKYYVDTNLLNAGVPIEQLEKQDVQVFKPNLKLSDFSEFGRYNKLAFEQKKRKRGDSRRDG